MRSISLNSEITWVNFLIYSLLFIVTLSAATPWKKCTCLLINIRSGIVACLDEWQGHSVLHSCLYLRVLGNSNCHLLPCLSLHFPGRCFPISLGFRVRRYGAELTEEPQPLGFTAGSHRKQLNSVYISQAGSLIDPWGYIMDILCLWMSAYAVIQHYCGNS